MPKGAVKSYKTKNGCGFIESENGDVFVHVSNILENEGYPQDVLIPGEMVEYELIEGRRGPAATKVQRLNPAKLDCRSGNIKRLFDTKGFGFIESSSGDVFFHYADVLFENFAIGDVVDYLLASTKSEKFRALKVRKNLKS